MGKAKTYTHMAVFLPLPGMFHTITAVHTGYLDDGTAVYTRVDENGNLIDARTKFYRYKKNGKYYFGFI